MSPHGGWQYGYNYALELETKPDDNPNFSCTSSDVGRAFRLRVYLPDGSGHILHLRDYSDGSGDGYYEISPSGHKGHCSSDPPQSQVSGALTYITSDSTFIKVVVAPAAGEGSDSACNDTLYWVNNVHCWEKRPWTIYFTDGRTVTGTNDQTEFIHDRNGNKITVHNVRRDKDFAGVWNVLEDDFNRVVTLRRTLSGSVPTDEITQQGYGVGNTLTWTVRWKKIAIATPGQEIEYECVKYSANDPGPTKGGGPCVLDWTVEHTVVDTIELPVTNLSYQFGYSINPVNPASSPQYGELNQITTPSGAAANYDYFLDGKRRLLGEIRNRLTYKHLQYTVVNDQVAETQTENWHYDGIIENGVFTATVRNLTNNATTTYKAFDPANQTEPLRGMTFYVQEPSGDVVEKYFARNAPYGVADRDPGNPFVRADYRTPAGGQTAAKMFEQDKNGTDRTSIRARRTWRKALPCSVHSRWTTTATQGC